ncbi:MAG: DNA adenine methylase, partial [Bacillati bacterium]
MIVRRPMVRYHGGKWMLAPWIIGHFPPHRIYVEPYGGGGSVLLRKPRSYAEIYNDSYGEIVNVFRIMQDQTKADKLCKLLTLTPFARDEFILAYEPADDDIERARRALIRSHMGFGDTGITQRARTGFRANSNRSGTTPAHDWANYPSTIPTFVNRLRGVVLESHDALDIMIAHDGPETLHYVDPPYTHDVRASKKRYATEMTDNDHLKLSDVLHGLTGMVVLSGYKSPLYAECYGDWERV